MGKNNLLPKNVGPLTLMGVAIGLGLGISLGGTMTTILATLFGGIVGMFFDKQFT